MECFEFYGDCLHAKNDDYECTYYDDVQQYCYISVQNTAWWVWLILAVTIILLISLVACGVCCCKKQKNVYKKIAGVKGLSEEHSHATSVSLTQNYMPYPQHPNVQNVQPIFPQTYFAQSVYPPMLTGVSNYSAGVQFQHVPHPIDLIPLTIK
ncbi:Hypothetical_protein [Hexamita inflata]|uniref:Hypothetical_protein n=1 Tax=Hexamita inflata TaxID=28002 RepID=A0AA86QZ93_9EUKA|nr:Hypothetical protein HINF_LOCUS54418 [Hexamita inflata]CAI9966776.1 Hypothetical protein HINF_LOCUS54421 [Hexamita inflata]